MDYKRRMIEELLDRATEEQLRGILIYLRHLLRRK